MLDVVDEAPTGYDAWLSISQSSVWVRFFFLHLDIIMCRSA
jgi:hypothetical protein